MNLSLSHCARATIVLLVLWVFLVGVIMVLQVKVVRETLKKVGY